jgi:hypothetical protein
MRPQILPTVAVALCAFMFDARVGNSQSTPFARQSALEVIATNTSNGRLNDNAGNGWGGHQTRIVRTNAGVFTTWLTGDIQRASQWRLGKRGSDGAWGTLAGGIAGREPVNMLAHPNGKIGVIGYPDSVGTLWEGVPQGNAISMVSSTLPIDGNGDWPYQSAGIDANGNWCALNSETQYSGGQASAGLFHWYCRRASDGMSTRETLSFDHRHAYTYVFPRAESTRTLALSLVSTRDVRWEDLGYVTPPGAFDYAFNALGYWRSPDIMSAPPVKVHAAEEPQTTAYPYVVLNTQMDAYLDTRGRMHMLYARRGASTAGQLRYFHRIVGPDGALLHDGEIKRGADTSMGWQTRITQDSRGRFYLLSASAAAIYPLDADGIALGEPVALNLGGHDLAYPGFFIAAPRTGTVLSDVIDVVFATEDLKWVYFSIDVSSGASAVTATAGVTPSAPLTPTPHPQATPKRRFLPFALR